MGAANSALLKLAGITTETKDPEGGRFGRDKSGEPDGYVEETPALMKVLAAAMPRMKMDMAEQMKEAQQLYLKYGITTVQEGAAMAQTMQGLTAFAASGGLELDVVAYILKEDYEKTVKEYADYNGKYKNRVKIGGVKVILDGSPQGKSAWLSKPYEGEENYCGYPTHNDADARKAAKDAVRGGYQIQLHTVTAMRHRNSLYRVIRRH